MTDAERYVLGAVMLSRTALDEVAEVLTPADMSTPRHEAVFAAIRRLHDQDAPTDLVAVGDELLRTGDMQGNLTPEYLHELTSAVPTASNAAYHARIVLDQAKRRRVVAALEHAGAVAQDASLPVDEAIELIRAAFDDVDAKTSQGSELIGDWYLDYLRSLEQKPSYIPTPWYDLNQLIEGVADGRMYVIAAETGGGKTVMAVQLARALAESRPVLYVSLEMGREEIAGRITAQTAQVFLGSLNRHQLGKTEWSQVGTHRHQIERLPLEIVSSDSVSTIPQLKAKVRAMARRTKRNPVVVIDYLQLLTSHERVENRQQEVAGFSRALKRAARQWNVPVIALSQFRRGQAGQKRQAPTMHDLRESGQIANDADVILLLDRGTSKTVKDELKVIVAKNRQGQTGEVTLVFQGQFSRVLSRYQADERLFGGPR